MITASPAVNRSRIIQTVAIYVIPEDDNLVKGTETVK